LKSTQSRLALRPLNSSIPARVCHPLHASIEGQILSGWQWPSKAVLKTTLSGVQSMTTTRNNQVTLKGNPIELAGKAISAGTAAPEFSLQANDLSEVTLKSTSGKTRIVATIPSLDTPVCHQETKRFNDEISKLMNVEVLVVSMDLPFGQKRWCGAEGVENVKTLSAHRCTKFGEDYGVLIRGGPLDRCLCRAIFVIGPDDQVKHVEYVKEIAEHPNYEAALAAARP
jgi:thiol peroxidase